MSTSRTKTVIGTGVAAICISGIGVASSAAAKTDTLGGGSDAARIRVLGIDEIVAMRKAQMAHDYIEFAAARAQQAARQ
jgi:hypothetical protein